MNLLERQPTAIIFFNVYIPQHIAQPDAQILRLSQRRCQNRIGSPLDLMEKRLVRFVHGQ